MIDGYNLTGVAHRDLNRVREELIRSIAAYRKARPGLEITLVFDGWKAGMAKAEVLRTAGITVVFSRLGETADAVIKTILDSAAGELIVITSDRSIASHAWSRGCVPVPSERFLSILGGSGTGAAAPDVRPEEEEDPLPAKGRARTLSKKEKALQRAIRKLR